MISIIAAMSKDRVIGNKNMLPWHLPADLKHFKSLTLGKPVIMGRKTFESIGKPLPNRKNIIISKDPNFKIPNCLCFASLEAALDYCSDDEEIMIIGGASLYDQAVPLADRIYLTLVETESVEGDAWFPKLRDKEWKENGRDCFIADNSHQYNYCFIQYDRKKH